MAGSVRCRGELLLISAWLMATGLCAASGQSARSFEVATVRPGDPNKLSHSRDSVVGSHLTDSRIPIYREATIGRKFLAGDDLMDFGLKWTLTRGL